MKNAKQIPAFSIRGALAVAGTALLLGGCASSPNTYSNADARVDFQHYQTYAFMQDLATDGDQYQSLDSTHLKESVAREMAARGLKKSDTPDLVINFSIDSKEKIRSRSVPSAGLHGDFYDPYYGYGMGISHQTHIDQYTEGMLNIVAVDTASNALVWEGSTKGRISKKVEQNWQATLNNAVIEIFEYFPLKTEEPVNNGQ
ncbi:MAG: DUF4136 domain-containing protein [Halioglobus sp.]